MALRTTTTTSSSNTPPTTRLRVRKLSSSRRRVLSLPARPLDPARPILVALNLRRLPSRQFRTQHTNVISQTNSDLENEEQVVEMNVPVGSKRKRIVSGGVNGHGDGRSTRALKRLRSATLTQKRQKYASSDEMNSSSDMEVDSTSSRWLSSGSSEEGRKENDGKCHGRANSDEDETSDHYLISSAPANQLLRLRKDELVKLYISAGLTEDAEILTKSEIVESLIAARDDSADLPPSSPTARGNSSEYSSDDGEVPPDNADSDEELLDHGPSGSGLQRRATFNVIGRSIDRPLNGRSMSMGTVGNNLTPFGTKKGSRLSHTKSKAGESSGGSEAATRQQHSASPPARRLRSRTTSNNTTLSMPVSTTSSTKIKNKNKTKQVEFSDVVNAVTPLIRRIHTHKRGAQNKRRSGPNSTNGDDASAEESDLTELEELERTLTLSNLEPSPRRLRSKDSAASNQHSKSNGSSGLDDEGKNKNINARAGRRVIPMRKAKKKIGSLKEDETEEEEDEEEGEGEASDGEVVMGDEDDEDEDEDQLDEPEDADGIEESDRDEEDTEEIDELVSSASISPPATPQARRTPLKKRLRPRRRQTFTPPSDGDDEGGEDEEEMEAEEQDVEEDIELTSQDSEDEEDADVASQLDEEENEETVVEQPRKLRNGKVVGEEEMEVDVESGSDAKSNSDEEADEEVEEDEGEVGEDDVDLGAATKKSLIRLRRDDLVRLCEQRELEAIGTKPQLASALLKWRDNQQNDARPSPPSSTGTIRPTMTPRPTATARPKRRSKKDSNGNDPAENPVLMRSHRVHLDEPRTPPYSEAHVKEIEPELELDLESLGLENREIPFGELVKLEKIGSGGFKDVFIGKFKRRKVAISEFRGQLSAMDIKELKLLGGFDHPNIVRFLGVSIPENTKETPVMIVSELCQNGDLFDYVRNDKTMPSLSKLISMMLDIARGLEYLHNCKPSIIHRDCKSSNILITTKGTAKIADFGLAKVKQSTRSMVRSLVGTVNWQAPELWHAHPKYNHKVDVFSCAMVYWEMMQWHLPNKKFPWEGMNEHAIYELVGAKRQRPSVSGLRKQWSPDLVELMEQMWAQDHQDRPTMEEVVQQLEALQ